MILRLYHDGRSIAEIPGLKDSIEKAYSPFNLQVQDRGYLFLPDRSEDLNAARLLKYLEAASGGQISLWLVQDTLTYPGIGQVFGCSAGRSAILSKSDLDPDSLIKEALHEVGHLMGLDHCVEHCVMSLSKSREEAGRKPYSFCPGCSALLRLKGNG